MASSHVPRLIHQTWKTAEVPAEYYPYVDTVRRLHPGYDYKLWTDADNRRLIADDFAWFLDTYDGYRHAIERADAIRYFLLYAYGGVYVDLDMEFLKPMDDLLRSEEPQIFFSLEAGPSIFQTVVSNAFMAAPKAHPFFLHVIESLARVKGSDITFADVFRNTGPDMLTAQLLNVCGDHGFHVLGLDTICPKGVLPQNKAVGFADLETIRAEQRLHAIHHNTESWNTQLRCPADDIDGYVLFENADIPGQDIEFVECPDGSTQPLLEACERNADAIGFNYNGFVKGRGGKLESATAASPWLKKGMVPWVCVKKDYVSRVRR